MATKQDPVNDKTNENTEKQSPNTDSDKKEISLKVSQSGKITQHTFSNETTILELKRGAMNERKLDSNPEKALLLHRGLILKNDTPIKDTALEEGATVYIILEPASKSSAETKTNTNNKNVSSPNLAGGQFPQYNNMYGNPQAMGSMPNMNASQMNMNQGGMGMNPGMFQHMNNSQMAQQLESVLNNDEMIDAILASTFPDVSADQRPMFKEMIRKQLSFMKNNPEQMQQILNNPQTAAMMGGMGGRPGMGGMNPGMGGMNNMYGQNPGMNNMYGYPQYGQQPFYPPQPQNVPLTPEQQNMSDELWTKAFANELKLMDEMGFKNKFLNLEALKKTRGDIDGAIELMNKWMN